MNSVADALNTLISAANIAQAKGVYSLEESHFIYQAISYLNSLSQQEAPAAPEAPAEQVEVVPPANENVPPAEPGQAF